MLADFNTAFIHLIKQHTGKQLPPVSDTFPDTWGYDKPHCTSAQSSAMWEEIKNSYFWLNLNPLPGAEATLDRLAQRQFAGDNVYFITSRPGKKAKLLTEYWLRNWGMGPSTVLIVDSEAAKGEIAHALKLDLFIDDKPENCTAVLESTEVRHVDLDICDTQVWYTYPCKVYLVDAPYNRAFKDSAITRVGSAMEALTFKLESLDAAA